MEEPDMAYREELETMQRENDQLRNRNRHLEDQLELNGIPQALKNTLMGAIPWLVGFVMAFAIGFGGWGLVRLGMKIYSSPPESVQGGEQAMREYLAQLYPGRVARIACTRADDSILCSARLEHPDTDLLQFVCGSQRGAGCRPR